MIATLALSISIARVLGDSAYGDYGSVWALFMIMTVVAHMGMDTIVVRESARDLGRAPDLVSNAITMRLGLSLFAYALAIVAALLMRTGQTFVGYVAIAGLIFFVSWHVLIATYFEATLRVGTHTLLTTGCACLTLALTLAVLFLRGGVGGVLWAAVAANFVTLVVAYVLVSRHFRPTLGRNLAVMKNILSASWPLGGTVFLIMLAARLDVLMVRAMKGPSVAGYYWAALRITESLTIISQAFMLSVFPLMSFYHSREPARFGDIHRKSLKYMAVIILPLALFLSFHSRSILRVFGESFVQGAPALAILAWFMFFVFIGSVNFGAIIVENRQKSFLFLSVFLMLVAIALNLLLIPRYSLTGAAVAAVLRQVIFYITMLLIPSMRKYTVAAATASFRPIVAVVCAAACLYWVVTPLGVFLALPVYVLVLLLIGGFDKEDRVLLLKVIRRT